MYLVATMLAASLAFTQIPREISYQGVLTDAAGAPAADGTYSLQFQLFPNETSGLVLFTEDHSVQVRRGSFKVLIGSLAPLNLSFDGPYYLQMTVIEGPNITEPVTFARTEFSSVPYSLRADTAEYAHAGKLSFPYVDTTVVANEFMLVLGNQGTGYGAFFANINSANPLSALVGQTAGTGPAITGSHGGTNGSAGFFNISQTGNNSPAIYAQTPNNGAAVEGDNDGNGPGVRGYSDRNFGVAGHTLEGTGVYGSNENSNTVGHAGYFNGRTRVTQDLLVDRNMGVGRSTAGARLDVTGGQYDLSATEGDVRIGSDTHRLKLGIATGGGGAGDARIRAQGGLNRLSLGTSTSDIITLYNGKVGIGDLNPATTLHVSNSSAPASFTLGVNSTGGGYTALLTSLSSVSGGYASLQAVQAAGSAYGNLVLNKDGGNVGVGTTTPSAALHVQGDLRTTGRIYDASNLAGTSRQFLSSTESGTAWINNPASTRYSNIVILNQTSSSNIHCPTSGLAVTIPGLTHTVTLASTTKVVAHLSIRANKENSSKPSLMKIYYDVIRTSSVPSLIKGYTAEYYMPVDDSFGIFSFSRGLELPPGTWEIAVRLSAGTSDTTYSCVRSLQGSVDYQLSTVTLEFIPQQ